MNFQNTFQWNETISSSYYSCWKYTSSKQHSFPLHCHAYYEISYIYSGERQELFDGQYYDTDTESLFFLPPLTVHGYHNKTQVQDMILQFSPAYLQALAPCIEKNTLLTLSSKDTPVLKVSLDSRLHALLKELYSRCNDTQHAVDSHTPPDNRTLIQNLELGNLLQQLILSLLHDSFLTFQTEERRYSDLQILDPVINHILSHPENMLSMQDAADMANISYFHFSRLFKNATGFNYSVYCNQIRLHLAED